MPFTLTMPKLSPTMDEGTIAKWHKNEGDFVAVGDVIMEVATDKATVEYNALDEGFLRKRLIPEGSEAHVNQPIAIFSIDKDESIEGYKPEGETPEAKLEASQEVKSAEVEAKPQPVQTGTMAQPRFVPPPPLENYTFEGAVGEIEGRLKASPLAKKIAVEEGLDLSTVQGTGPGGRVMKRDLERAQPSGDFTFGRREVPTIPPGTYEELPLNPMRKTISRRLQEAKTFIPHFYVTRTIDAEPLTAFRDQLRTIDVKVSFNDCVVKACAMALRKHPRVNSGFNSVNNTIILFKTIDIAIAVSFDGGLITPIVRHTDYKNLGEISQEVRSLAKRGKTGKLEAHEYQGGSFTVSNLGMYNVTDFQAIINPPQSCILAVSGILDTPVVKNGAVVPGKTMNLTLSCDHRVVDGVAGAEFLSTLKHYLENPVSLLL